MSKKLTEVDSLVSYLFEKMFENHLLHCVNVIILADHGRHAQRWTCAPHNIILFTGMQTIYDEFLQLDKFVSNTNGMVVTEGPVGRITLQNSSLSKFWVKILFTPYFIILAYTAEEVVANLSCKFKNALVYKLDEVPTRFHFNGNSITKRRIGDIIIVMEPGYLFKK